MVTYYITLRWVKSNFRLHLTQLGNCKKKHKIDYLIEAAKKLIQQIIAMY